ncbi:MAG TPA: DUF4105 domain-containing protein [Solimonas sp.]|nr:DUF4105 domain-containing protein [Solimonas sp.]
MRHVAAALLALACCAWGLAACLYTPVALPLRLALLAAALAGSALAFARTSVLRGWLAVALAGLALGLVLRAVPEASSQRAWIAGQARAPTAEIAASGVTIHDVRNFRYQPSGALARAVWETRTYDPAHLDSVWLGVSPFGGIPGVGHVFVSFGFDDGRYLAVSVEARKEQREAYGPFPGMFRNYELVYVVGDERDVVALRTNVWKDAVYLYPLKATKDAMRAAFLDILERANRLARAPEFYDTLTNSCSVNLARHANHVVPGRVPPSFKILLAGFSDELAHELGLLDFEGSMEQARVRYRVNDRAQGDVDQGDFSARIRGLPSGA